MTKTPIQQAIEKFEKLQSESKSLSDVVFFTGVLATLDVLLTEERKFAEECFDAGYEEGKLLMKEAVGRITMREYDELSTDFSTFYKNNYEDGK